MQAAPDFLKPFQEAVRNSGRKGKPPALIHMDFDAISWDGVYRWGEVKELLQKELGWVDAPAQNKGLHTSCKLERCKEYTQLLRFREMQANLIPFSAVEMPLAVLEGCISREAAVEELKRHSGFSQEAPAEMQLMYDFLTSKDAGISASSNAGRDRAQG